jgi:predicted transcriptional regulator
VEGEAGTVELRVADLVRVCRTRAGLSARQLSSLADLSPSYVTKLEAGELEPSLRSFARIVLALHMTSSEVMFCVTQSAH